MSELYRDTGQYELIHYRGAMKKLIVRLVVVVLFSLAGAGFCADKTVVIPLIGDTGPGGGIVFYVTDGGRHGLEAAREDQSSDTYWGSEYTITGAYGTAIGTGAQNTIDILNVLTDPEVAARVAYNGFNGWFLPSKDELNLLYQNKDIVGGFASDAYWTSTQYDLWDAWMQHFFDGKQYGFKKYLSCKVRAIRAF